MRYPRAPFPKPCPNPPPSFLVGRPEACVAVWAQVVLSIIGRRIGMGQRRYVPNFKSAIDFFCIHAGGRAVLDGIEKNLSLDAADMAPSRSVLFDRGNTSSSSIWYELKYIEEHTELRRGHKILQLAFGSGFKCNSAVWTRIR